MKDLVHPRLNTVDDLIPDATAEEFSIPQGYTHMQTVKSDSMAIGPPFSGWSYQKLGVGCCSRALDRNITHERRPQAFRWRNTFAHALAADQEP